MTESTSDATSEGRRKDVFSRLVEVQDGGASVVESRRLIAQEFVISVDDVMSIEREGISSRWPPL